MTREEEAKRKFEEENNVIVEGDFGQVVYPSDSLDGAETGYNGNPNNPPTPKQLYEIGYILRFCPDVHEFKGVTAYEAWEFTKKIGIKQNGMVANRNKY